MNGEAVASCSDDTLRKELNLTAMGDILALRSYVMMRNGPADSNRKKELAKAIREGQGTSGTNSKKIKGTRLIHLGWQSFNEKKRKYTNVKKSGGARSVEMAKDASTDDLIETAKSLFFPDGKSHLGSKDLFTFKLGNFGCDIISEYIGKQEPFTLERYVKYNKLTHVRLYLLSRKKGFQDCLAYDDDDATDDEVSPLKLCDKCNQQYYVLCVNCSHYEEMAEDAMQDDEKCKCGRTLKDGYCLPCQQDLNFQRSLEMDRAKTMRNLSQQTQNIRDEQSTSGSDDSTSITVDEVRDARVKRFANKPIRYRHSIGSTNVAVSAKKSINTAAGASDVKFGDDEILRFLSDEADKFDDTVCHVAEDSSSDDFLFEAWEAYKGSRFEKSKKTVIVQRAIDRFWTIFLKQKFDFVLHDVSVRFAGESAADCGGPFREFLTLATSRLADAGNMFFGDKSRIGFTAFPEHVIKKHYFTMGQLCGVSVLHLGRGPECFHPAITRAIYDIKQPVEIEPFDDAMLEATLSEIENGNLVSLLEYNIVPAGRDKVDLKHLFVVSFLINNKFVAIDQFKKGMGSVSPSLVESCHFVPMRKYLEHVKDISYSFQDIVNIISYPQANSFDEGSNNLTRFQKHSTQSIMNY